MVIPSGDEVTEREVQQAVIDFLPTCAYGEASLKKLMFELPGTWIRLSARDREMQRKRPTDQKWHAMLRNIDAHRDQPGNAIHDGILVKRRGGGYQLASRAKINPVNEKNGAGPGTYEGV
jgi:hypothetical protein